MMRQCALSALQCARKRVSLRDKHTTTQAHNHAYLPIQVLFEPYKRHHAEAQEDDHKDDVLADDACGCNGKWARWAG